MTTSRNDLGISPVLFQAIAQLTASASTTPSQDSVVNQSERTSSHFKQSQSFLSKTMEGTQSPKDASQMVTQLLQRLNEPVVSILPYTNTSSQNHISTLSNQTTVTDSHHQSALTKAGLSMLGISSDNSDPNNILANVTVSTQQQQQMASNSVALRGEELSNFLMKQEPVEDEISSSLSTHQPTQQAMNNDVSSVLSALANQHVQESMLQRKEGNQRLLQQQQQQNVDPLRNSSSATTTSSLIANFVNSSESEQQRTQQPQIIIYGLQYGNNNNDITTAAAPGSASSLQGTDLNNSSIVLEGEGNNNTNVQTTTYRVLVQSPDGGSVEGKTVMLPSDSNSYNIQQFSGSVSGEMGGVQPISDVQNAAEGMTQPCPVCGDKVSGYHYGIFTCESCKGFFKRTVQNKKSFVCPKASDCIVNAVNRKKCPACRFKRCLQMGMKLEAIRQDRTRGGRSSYDGCTSHKNRSPASTVGKKIKKQAQAMDGMLAGPSLELDDGTKSHRNLVAILNHNVHKPTAPNPDTPVIPELLRDIMNLEPLLSDDDIPPDSIMENSFPDQALYSYMMQLAELRLYKLVRWARNLPQFGAISTDDQILLLQNCWSELIALALCWRSIDTPDQISISSTHHITTEWAQHLGCEDLVARLLSITDAFRNLYMDNYEYVALKVLLLISPDVKGLKEPKKIRDFQDKLMEALMIYTMSHHTTLKNKFGELLLRLPELSRLSYLSKNILLKYLPTNSTTCGLLVELLKGDSRVESQDNSAGASGSSSAGASGSGIPL